MHEHTDGLPEIEFESENLRANYREIVRRVGSDIRMMPSIKADAYGFGALEMAKVFEDLGAFALFTGNVREAIEIRQSGVRTPIVMFGACLPGDIRYLLSHELIPTVHNRELVEAVSASASEPTDVYVKVDAGLGRLGVPLAEAVEFIRMAAQLNNVVIGGVYTHLPFATSEGTGWARQRLAAFDDLLDSLEAAGLSIPVRQARASSCIAAGLRDKANAICVGHLLYGLSPFSDDTAGDLRNLRPVVRTMRSRLIHVGRHSQGSDLAIGGLYGLRHGKVTGVLPIGLSNGLGVLRPSSPTSALIRDQQAPLLSVSLEHTTIDLDAVEAPAVGDEVILVDEAIDGGASLSAFAAAQGRTPLEMMVSLSGRWRRTYSDTVKSVWSGFNQ